MTEPSRSRNSTVARRPIRLFVFLLSLVPLLVLFEFVVRYENLLESGGARRDSKQTALLPARLKANFSGLLMGLPFHTNRFGFRDQTQLTRTVPEGTFRILALGDSVGIGMGLPLREHYTKVLERHLNEAGDSLRFQVVNAAGMGYSPSSYLVYLRHEGMAFRPRLLLVEVELCNDVSDEALLHWVRDPRHPHVPLAVRGGRYIVNWDGNLVGGYSTGSSFFQRTYLYNLLSRRLLGLLFRLHPRGPFASGHAIAYYNLGFDRYLLTESRLEQGWKRLFLALQGIQRLARSHHSNLLIAFIPSRYVFEDQAPEWQEFGRRVLQRAESMASQEALPFLDFVAAMKRGGGRSLYLDFAHPTRTGNEIIGREIADYVLQRYGEFTPNHAPQQSAGNRTPKGPAGPHSK